MVMSGHQVLRTSAASAVTADSRVETFNGREYLVVPVVALVEGVVQGANSPQPEFVPLEAMAKAPMGWNGRPLVMNHPTTLDDRDQLQYVSANSPEILEGWAFGHVFSAKTADRKLKVEAWIDIARAEELGGEFVTTLERARNNEIIEVSTGLFAEVDANAKGTFNKKSYEGEWTSIHPDHLAFLSEGVKGACSIADGCGANRVNSAQLLIQEAQMHVQSATAGCGCGGSCGNTDCAPETIKPQDPAVLTQIMDAIRGVLTPTPKPVVLSAAQIAAGELQGYQNLLVHSIDGAVTFGDADRHMRAALKAELDRPYIWVAAMTADMVVYDAVSDWDSTNLVSRNYKMDSEGNVKFTSEPVEVALITKIVSRPAKAKAKANASGEDGQQDEPTTGDPSETPNPEVDMPGEQELNQTPAAPAPGETVVAPATPATPEAAPVVNAEAAPVTTAQWLAAMPKDMRESIEQGQRLLQKARTDLVTSIKANSRNKFTDEQLSSFDIPTLENLAALADADAPSYEGRAAAGARQVNNSAGDEPQNIAAPRVFESPAEKLDREAAERQAAA
jgi:hypothetical protein